MLNVWKKSWEPFWNCLLNSPANPAHFPSNRAGLAVLFSRELLNGTHDFFQIFRICLFNHFIKNPQTTISLTFLTYIISDISGAISDRFNLEKNTKLNFLFSLKSFWSSLDVIQGRKVQFLENLTNFISFFALFPQNVVESWYLFI